MLATWPNTRIIIQPNTSNTTKYKYQIQQKCLQETLKGDEQD